MPGGSWNGLNNMASVMHYQSIGGGGTRLPTPIHPPRTGEPTLVPVNTKPLVRSGVASSQSFVFRKDSAGLGVPRDSFGKLEKVSQHTDSRGEVNEHIYLAAPASAMPNGRVTNTAIMAGSIHRGSPPPASSSTYEPSMAGASSSGRSSGPSAPSMPSASTPSHASGGPSSSGGSGSARSH
jgi:hypothetical protein